MTDTRKVIVNGTEYEVELEGEGTLWKATVGGQTFDIEMPEAAVAAKPRRSGGRKKKKSGTVSANIPGKVVTVEVEEGQEVKVKLLGFDDRGKVRLSMKIVDQETGEEIKAEKEDA